MTLTQAETIADLDAALAARGEYCYLQRTTLAPGGVQVWFEVRVRASVRGYKPDELIGGITQQDEKVVFSPSAFHATGWNSGRQPPEDTRIPMKNNNRIRIKGRMRSVEAAQGIYMGGELVRIEMQVRG